MNDLNKKKNEFIEFCLKKDNKFPNHKLPKIYMGNKLETVFIEFRLLPYTIFIIKNTILKLGSSWSHTIVCGNNNYDFYNNFKKECNLDIKIIKLDINNLTREEYSIMLLESTFYDHFLGKHLLFYQEDSLIFRKFDKKYLEYDFIGAPYYNKDVGNGGFSLRTKEIIINICKKYFDPYLFFMKKNVRLLNEKKKGKKDFYKNKNNMKYYYIEQSILEDLQICNRLKYHKLGKLPNFDTAREFSIEKYYHPNPFGGHQFWYCIKDIKKFLNEKLGY
tara:strand:- start:1354 stop:2181 length:828 start_codon:yes stop_codon:yes gene_type:complete